MNARTTVILLLLVGLLLGGLWWNNERKAASPDPTEGQPLLLAGFEDAFVTRIELDLEKRESVGLEVRDRLWWIVEPIADRARQNQVENLIDVLAHNPRTEIEAEPSRETLATNGLEPPQMRVTLLADEGKRAFRLRVGETDPTGETCYVYIEGDPKLYRTGANLRNILCTPRQEWRDERFVIGDGALVRRIELTRSGEAGFVAERSGVEWTIVEPTPFPGDDSMLGRLVNGLLLLKIENFAVSNPSEESIVSHNVGDKATVVALDFPGRRLEMRFGVRKDNTPESKRYAMDSERKHLFIVDGPVLPLLDASEKQFRDRRIVRASVTDLTHLIVRRTGQVRFELKYLPAEKRFVYVQPFALPSDDERSSQLRTWLIQLSSLAAAEKNGFIDPAEVPEGVDPSEAFNFKDPRYAVELETASGAGASVRVTIEVGDPDGLGNYFVRRLDRHPEMVYLVSQTRVDAVLDVDPRLFLARALAPSDLENFEVVTITMGERVREIRRHGEGRDRAWRDPQDEKRNTSDIESYAFRLKNLSAERFLGRDVSAEDGLDPPFATVVVRFGGARANDDPLTIQVGAKDETGKLARVTTSELPKRTVADVEAWVRDDLEALFK